MSEQTLKSPRDSDSQPTDKIRVLVVDDMPDGLPRRRVSGSARPPMMAAEFDNWFDFRWLATPEECRDFHDLSARLSLLDPQLLDEHGWVPEIMAIDYALTQSRQSVSDLVGRNSPLLSDLSPLPRLRACATRTLPKAEALPSDACPVDARAGSEFWGCFIGGLLLNTFGDHPCAPVTITRYTPEQLQQNAPDAAMFEWLLKWQTSDLLRASGKVSSPSWDEILLPGAKALQRRIEDLAKASVIDIALSDLLALATSSDHSVLTVTSRFSRRRYPVKGLFVGAASTTEAKTWALSLLRRAWWAITKKSATATFANNLSEIRQAWKASGDLWYAYDSDKLDGDFRARMRLSELAVLSDRCGGIAGLTAKDAKELRKLMRKFGMAKLDDSAGCSKRVWDIRERCHNKPAVERWVVLFGIVLLLNRRCEAVHRTHALPEEVLPANRMLLQKQIDVDDLYLALFPIAKNPLRLPYHADNPAKARNNWQKYLSRLGISVKDLLEGNGFLPGERIMLRMFAAAISYGWRSDDNPQAIQVLRGP